MTVSIKAHGQTPGDATSDQMRVLADLSETYGYSELRISHEQNVILPHVHKSDLPAIHQRLADAGVVTSLRTDRTGRQYLRLSPHFYNTDAELGRALDLL